MPPLRTTSFIAKPTSEIADIKPVDPFFILGCVFLCVSILCSISAYGYGAYLDSENQRISQEIAESEKTLNKYPLKEMLAFDTQIKLVQRLLNKHTFPSTIFAALSNGVEKNVYYSSFGLSYTPGQGHVVTLTAVAPDYESIYRQMESLKSTAYGALFKKVDLVSLGKDQYGNKKFDVRIDVVGNLREDDIIFTTKPTIPNAPAAATIIIPSTPPPVVNATPTSTTGSSSPQSL